MLVISSVVHTNQSSRCGHTWKPFVEGVVGPHSVVGEAEVRKRRWIFDSQKNQRGRGVQIPNGDGTSDGDWILSGRQCPVLDP